MKWLLPIINNVAPVTLALLSVLCFGMESWTLAVTFLLTAIGLEAYNQFRPTLKRITELEAIQRSNAWIEIKIDFEKLLRQKEFDELFLRLKKKNGFQFDDGETWVKTLLSNVKTKYPELESSTSKKQEQLLGKVVFRLKRGVLWRNDEMLQNDVIHQDWFFPYDLSDDDGLFSSGIDKGVAIRLIVANGRLKLQISNHDEDTSPKVVKSSTTISAYQRRQSLAEFPLFCFTELGIPANFLNFDERFGHRISQLKAGIRVDELGEDDRVAWNYGELMDVRDRRYTKNHLVTIRDFEKIKTTELASNGFKTSEKRDDDGGSMGALLKDDSVHYWNDFMLIWATDPTRDRKRLVEYVLPDTWTSSIF